MNCKYFQPLTIQDTCLLLEEHSKNAAILAGGTDLVISIKKGDRKPEIIIDISAVTSMPIKITIINEHLTGKRVTEDDFKQAGTCQKLYCKYFWGKKIKLV